jgi:hypothetical protein
MACLSKMLVDRIHFTLARQSNIISPWQANPKYMAARQKRQYKQDTSIIVIVIYINTTASSVTNRLLGMNETMLCPRYESLPWRLNHILSDKITTV